MITKKDIWKKIWDMSDNWSEYIEWRIVAIDCDWRIICDFVDLEWEVFLMEEKYISFINPKDIIQIELEKLKKKRPMYDFICVKNKQE